MQDKPPFFWLGDEAETAAAESETLEQLARELPSLDAEDDD